jgi:hypothetical protein
LQALANPAYLSRFLVPTLSCVALYCARNGIKVVSIFARVASLAFDSRDGLVIVCIAAHVVITARCNEVDPYGLALCHAGLDGVHYLPGRLFRALSPLLRNRYLIHTLTLFKLLTLLIALLRQFGREAEEKRIVGGWRVTVPASGRWGCDVPLSTERCVSK